MTLFQWKLLNIYSIFWWFLTRHQLFMSGNSIRCWFCFDWGNDKLKLDNLNPKSHLIRSLEYTHKRLECVNSTNPQTLSLSKIRYHLTLRTQLCWKNISMRTRMEKKKNSAQFYATLSGIQFYSYVNSRLCARLRLLRVFKHIHTAPRLTFVQYFLFRSHFGPASAVIRCIKLMWNSNWRWSVLESIFGGGKLDFLWYFFT